MKTQSENAVLPVLFIVLALVFYSTKAVAIDLIDTKGNVDRLQATVNSDGWTLVMLWAHDCIPCERQKPMIEKYYRANRERGLNVVGISTDSKALRDKAIQTYRASKTSFKNFYFEGADFSDSYRRISGREFLGTPTYMVYDTNGKLRGTHTGTVNPEMLDKQFGPVLEEPEFTPSVDLLR